MQYMNLKGGRRCQMEGINSIQTEMSNDSGKLLSATVYQPLSTNYFPSALWVPSSPETSSGIRTSVVSPKDELLVAEEV